MCKECNKKSGEDDSKENIELGIDSLNIDDIINKGFDDVSKYKREEDFSYLVFVLKIIYKYSID